MYRIRFHGRGGQGMKTASRILGSALFRQGFEVQDAPRYAAERRGAPIAAYVRADHGPIHERGAIARPDLVVVADDSLVGLPAAGVLAGLDADSVLLIASHESPEAWRGRLNLQGRVVVLPVFTETTRADLPFVGVACAAAAARMIGLPWEAVDASIASELCDLGAALRMRNAERARAGFDFAAAWEGCVCERADASVGPPDWIDMPFESAALAAPAIHATATSVQVRTGLWRLLRPVVDSELCHGCWWVCSTLCPDGAIAVADGRPVVDYEHCKGCMVCVAVCPHHAIAAVPEHPPQTQEGA